MGTSTNKMILKAGIFDPYLDTLGGGERYCLTVAEILKTLGYQVDIFWSGDQDLLHKAEVRFNLDLSNINLIPDIFSAQSDNIEMAQDSESLTTISHHHHIHQKKIASFINKFKITSSYDLIFFLSDWSVPFLFSKKNILHVQVPFVTKTKLKNKLITQIKCLFLNQIVCNSRFTANFASRHFGSKCSVLYPPVDVEKFDPSLPKENHIISVGRFDNILNSKKQEVMIEAFRSIYHQHKDFSWRLILAGGSLSSPEKNNYLRHLQHLAIGLPIDFIVNPEFNSLKKIFSEAKIYWHAAGFGVDESIHPESTEHFGMAPVEAMASGCVPILINRGGLGEIIDNEHEGFLWNETKELVAKTELLMSSPSLLSSMSKQSILRSANFSKEKFKNELKLLLNIL